MLLKVCGVTRPEDAELAAEVGASYVGVIIDAESPRLIDEKRAKDIKSVLPKSVKLVGVVDARRRPNVNKILNSSVDVVQLHWASEESYWKYSQLKSYGLSLAVALTEERPWRFPAEYVLLDVKDHSKKLYAWALRGVAPVGVAGKITPENVRDVVALTKPDLVDVSSGVEERPGVKSPEKVRKIAEVIGLVL